MNYKVIRKNMLWNSVGSIFYMGCLWLMSVLVVRFSTGFAEAGILSLAMSISTALWGVSTLNLRTFQISELRGEFCDYDFIHSRILTSFLSLAFCIASVLINGYAPYESLCIVVFMAFKLSESFADVLHGVMQKAWRLDIAGKSFVLRGLVVLITFTIGQAAFKNLLFTFLLMASGVYLVILFFDIRICKSEIGISSVKGKRRAYDLIKIGIPLGLYSVIQNLIPIVPRLGIEKLYGAEMLGIFSSIITPTVLIPQLAAFVFNPLMGLFAQRLENQDKKGLYHAITFSLGVMTMIALCAVVSGHFWGEWAMVLLFQESIRPYCYLLLPAIATAILTAFIWFLCGLLTVKKDFYPLAFVSAVSLCLCWAVSKELLCRYGLLGGMIAIVLGLAAETLLLTGRLIFLLHQHFQVCT